MKGFPFVKTNSDAFNTVLDSSNCLILNQDELKRQLNEYKAMVKEQIASNYKELPVRADPKLSLTSEKWILVMQRDNFGFRSLLNMDGKAFHSFMYNQILMCNDIFNVISNNTEATKKLTEKFFSNLEARDLKAVFCYELFKNNLKKNSAPHNSQFIENFSENCKLVQVNKQRFHYFSN